MDKRTRSKKDYRFALHSKNGKEGIRLVKKFSTFDKARQEGLQLINDELNLGGVTSTCRISAISNEEGNDACRCLLIIAVYKGLINELFNF